MKLAVLMTLTLASTAHADVLSNTTTKQFFLGKVETGEMPKGMATTNDGKLLYVADMAGRKITPEGRYEGNLTIIDIDRVKLHRILKTPTGPRPRTLGNIEVEMTEDGRYALVTRMEGCGPGGETCPEKYKPSESLPYPMVFAIDTRTEEIVKMIPTKKAGLEGGDGPKVIKIRPMISPSIGYVANYFSNDLTIMDLERLSSTPVIDTAGERIKGLVKLSTTHVDSKGRKRIAPRGIAFTSDGRHALVMGAESNSLFVVDAIEHKQIAELAAPTDSINFRHVVTNKAGTIAYISHMHGNAISRIDIPRLLQIARRQSTGGESVSLPAATWKEILIPFPTAKSGFLVLEEYPLDHPTFPGQKYKKAEPNTIVLDPVNERYLYVSFRTAGLNYDGINDNQMTPMNQKGKVDIVDLERGVVVKSLIGGVEPTALAVTPDNRVLMSSGFRDNQIYFFDLAKILSMYEAQDGRVLIGRR